MLWKISCESRRSSCTPFSWYSCFSLSFCFSNSKIYSAQFMCASVWSCYEFYAKYLICWLQYYLVLGFRDHTVYKGRQVFLYKRAQIFAADLWGAFGGQGYGEFKDIGSLTIMADYIVPAVLRQLGVLKYSPTLASTIESSGEIGPGTEEEVELRACSVHAVEKMRELISKKSGRQVSLFFREYLPLMAFSNACKVGRLFKLKRHKKNNSLLVCCLSIF